MICPFCQQIDNYVLETRQTSQGQLRRRRQCVACQSKFTTIEKVYLTRLMVKKSDGRQEQFDREKVKRGMVLALKKRGFSEEMIERMVRRVEDFLFEQARAVVSSTDVGNLVMNELKRVDKVAYLRFTSVCKDFVCIKQFEQEMKNL